MDTSTAITAFSALAHEARLAIFRHLVEAGPDGLPAGAIGAHFGLPGATLSFHLKALKEAGLVTVVRQGRERLHAANYDQAQALTDFLMENCCRGVQPPDTVRPAKTNAPTDQHAQPQQEL